jgi:NADH-ubiquinone oxidoreductase chain 5
MWNIPLLTGLGLNFILLFLGKRYLKDFDQGWSEYYGSQNLYCSMKKISQILQRISLDSLKVNLFLISSLFFYIMYLSF